MNVSLVEVHHVIFVFYFTCEESFITLRLTVKCVNKFNEQGSFCLFINLVSKFCKSVIVSQAQFNTCKCHEVVGYMGLEARNPGLRTIKAQTSLRISAD